MLANGSTSRSLTGSDSDLGSRILLDQLTWADLIASLFFFYGVFGFLGFRYFGIFGLFDFLQNVLIILAELWPP